MTHCAAHATIRTLLFVGVLHALLATVLAYLSLMTLAALVTIGTVGLLVWAAALIIWALWG